MESNIQSYLIALMLCMTYLMVQKVPMVDLHMFGAFMFICAVYFFRGA